MRSLVRRIEMLEKCVAKQRGTVARCIEDAVNAFCRQATAGEIQLLISAFGGERTGRPLTAAEAEVRTQLLERAQHEFQRSEIVLRTTASPEIVILHAVTVTLSAFLIEHGVDFRLLYSGLDAMKAGREPSKEERAAVDTCATICAHLAQLAGFSSFYELDECMRRTWETRK